MKFLHTSDWHLGAAEGERSLIEDQMDFIEKLCTVITEKKVDALIIAGDVYDRAVASAEAIKLYNHAMTKICRELDVPVLIIAGNHDSAERLATCSALLEKAGLYVSGAAKREADKVPFKDTDVYFLPWITEAKVKSLYPEEQDNVNSLTDAYRVMTAHMRESFTPGKKHIIISHAFITNSETSTSDRAAEIGSAIQVSASVFDGFDYVALGHIHKPQDVNSFIRYSGTPIAYSFGKEETQEKSVTILDTETMEREIVPLHALHPRKTLSGTFAELTDREFASKYSDDYVRIIVTDSSVGLEMMAQLKAIYNYPLIISGKNYDDNNASITMTIDELERMEHDPTEVFRSFCREIMNEEATEHQMQMFERIVTAAAEGKE